MNVDESLKKRMVELSEAIYADFVIVDVEEVRIV